MIRAAFSPLPTELSFAGGEDDNLSAILFSSEELPYSLQISRYRVELFLKGEGEEAVAAQLLLFHTSVVRNCCFHCIPNNSS